MHLPLAPAANRPTVHAKLYPVVGATKDMNGRGRRGIGSPLYVAAYVYLWVGLALAVYYGLDRLGAAPGTAWIAWSHVHFVTVGGFAQLLFGLLPRVAAERLGRPEPPTWYAWLNLVGLNAGFLLAWYGRAFGRPPAFDVGLTVVVLLVAGLLTVLLRQVYRSDRSPGAGLSLSLLSVFVFLWGLVYAYGLYGRQWSVPGGWSGLREAHIHSNAWGFLGLATIGLLFEGYSALVDTDLHSERLRTYSAWLLALGVFPLITGPWLGRRFVVTTPGLGVYVAGFGLYLYNLLRTYLAGTRSGVSLFVLLAQFWVPALMLFTPLAVFGVGVPPTVAERGVLHFLFTGWALSTAFAGLLLYAGGPPDTRGPSAPPSTRTVAAWNLSVLVFGVALVLPDHPWSVALFGAGFAGLSVLWLYFLVAVLRVHSPGTLADAVIDR